MGPPRPHPVGNQVPRLTRVHVRRLTHPELVRAGRRQMPPWGSWDTWVRSLPGPGPQTPHYRVTPMHGLAEEEPPRPSGFDPGGLFTSRPAPAEPTWGIGCGGAAGGPRDGGNAAGRAWSIRFCMRIWCIWAFCISIISTMSERRGRREGPHDSHTPRAPPGLALHKALGLRRG